MRRCAPLPFQEVPNVSEHQAVISRQDDGSELHPRLLEQYGRAAELASASVEDEATHRGHRVDHHEAVLSAIQAKRTEVRKLHRDGPIRDEVLRSIEWELDLQQIAAESRVV